MEENNRVGYEHPGSGCLFRVEKLAGAEDPQFSDVFSGYVHLSNSPIPHDFYVEDTNGEKQWFPAGSTLVGPSETLGLLTIKLYGNLHKAEAGVILPLTSPEYRTHIPQSERQRRQD